jgi:hypothetical protein
MPQTARVYAIRKDNGWFRADVSFTEDIPAESYASATRRCNVNVITPCNCIYKMPIPVAEWRSYIKFAGKGKCPVCVCRHAHLVCTCGEPSCQPMDTAPAPASPLEAAAATQATHAPVEKRSAAEAGLAEWPASKRLAEAAVAAGTAAEDAAAASSSAPSHPSGAGPSGATKSAERAAADMAVRTKPPPGWTKVMDYGKLKGYRSPDGRKAISLPAAWRLYDEQQARAAVCPPPSSAPPCTDAPPPSSRKQPVPTPSAESSVTATVAAPAPATALATALVPYFGSRTSSRRGKQPLDPAVGKRVWSWRQDLQREMAGEIMDFQFWQDRVREHFVRYEDGVSLWRPEAEWWEDEDT